jgi:hypothetical protein
VRDVLAATAGLMPRRGRGASAAAVPDPPNSFFSLIGTTFKTTDGFYPKRISLTGDFVRSGKIHGTEEGIKRQGHRSGSPVRDMWRA